jgi:mercuric reductase
MFTLVGQGRTPDGLELAKLVGEGNIDESLQRLSADDLIVLDSKGKRPVGAYPVTLENTPHTILVNGNTIHAMCALDALSVAPMFNTEVVIDSVCYVSRSPVHIYMQGSNIVEAQPSMDVTVGIRWQDPSAVAARSLCLEMVFLKDQKTSKTWQGSDVDNMSLFTLPEAIEFGKAFFLPLLD